MCRIYRVCQRTFGQFLASLLNVPLLHSPFFKSITSILTVIRFSLRRSIQLKYSLYFSLRVAELLYSARDDWTAVCRCLIADTFRHHEIWTWLESLPSSSFQHVVLAQASPLVKIDAARLASLIATKAPAKFTKILERLSNESSCLEYSLLSALHNIANYREDEEDDRKLELSTAQLENFLSLMCQHEPDRVVNHMNSHHGCRLDEALRIVREKAHREAEAVMLEKLGNYQEAFDLLLSELHERLQIVNIF